MANHQLAINHARIRKAGEQLTRLALAGQACLVIAIVAAPYLLWKVAEPTMTYSGFFHFASTLMQSGHGPENAHALVKGVCYLLLLECVRRWGMQLSKLDSTGRVILGSLPRLKWAVALVACVSAFSFGSIPSGYWPTDMSSVTPEDFARTSRMTWDFSVWPIFGGSIVFICLRIAERIIAGAEILRAENAEFI